MKKSLKDSHHPAKFGGHKHSRSGSSFSLSCDLKLMTSSAPGWLVIWVNFSRCTCLPNLVIIGLVEMEISILTWIPRNNLRPWSFILRDFQTKEYWCSIPNSGTRLAGKQHQSRKIRAISKRYVNNPANISNITIFNRKFTSFNIYIYQTYCKKLLLILLIIFLFLFSYSLLTTDASDDLIIY